MARYLSDQWFELLGTGPAAEPTSVPALILQQVITGAPGGETRYHVRIGDGWTAIVRGAASDPDATFTEDYPTAAAIAAGELSTVDALLAGRIRVAGNMASLVSRQAELAFADPIPPAVRAATTY